MPHSAACVNPSFYQVNPLKRIGSLDRNLKTSRAVDDNTLTSRNRVGRLVTVTISPIVSGGRSLRIHRRIIVRETRTLNGSRKTFPDREDLSTPTNATRATITNDNLLDISRIATDSHKRNRGEVVVGARRTRVVADGVCGFDVGASDEADDRERSNHEFLHCFYLSVVRLLFPSAPGHLPGVRHSDRSRQFLPTRVDESLFGHARVFNHNAESVSRGWNDFFEKIFIRAPGASRAKSRSRRTRRPRGRPRTRRR